MSRLTLRFAGPLQHSLWKRFRRRYFHGAATAAAAVVTYSVIAVEPNLSGVWVDPNDSTYSVEIFHVGKIVHGHGPFGARQFAAQFVEENRVEGWINMYWNERMAAVCGSYFSRVANDYVMEVRADYEEITTSVTSHVHSQSDCTFQRTQRNTRRLVRRGY